MIISGITRLGYKIDGGIFFLDNATQSKRRLKAMSTDVIRIYYEAFGEANLRERRRRYAAQQLHRKMQPLRHCVDRIGRCTDRDRVCRTLKQLARDLNDDDLSPMARSDYRFRRYYRNHIYPAEVEDPASMFYRADLGMLDALLLDRDPDAATHHRHRAEGFVLRQRLHPL